MVYYLWAAMASTASKASCTAWLTWLKKSASFPDNTKLYISTARFVTWSTLLAKFLITILPSLFKLLSLLILLLEQCVLRGVFSTSNRQYYNETILSKVRLFLRHAHTCELTCEKKNGERSYLLKLPQQSSYLCCSLWGTWCTIHNMQTFSTG